MHCCINLVVSQLLIVAKDELSERDWNSDGGWAWESNESTDGHGR